MSCGETGQEVLRRLDRVSALYSDIYKARKQHVNVRSLHLSPAGSLSECCDILGEFPACSIQMMLSSNTVTSAYEHLTLIAGRAVSISCSR